jgi:hypothetical protein
MNNKIKICRHCKKEFIPKYQTFCFCSDECKNAASKFKIDEKFKDKKEGYDYIICKLCGNKVQRIYGTHLNLTHPGVTSIDYKNLFPNEPLVCQIVLDKLKLNSRINMLGEKNINHKSKTTEKERKERSPFSKEWYEKRDLTENDRKEFINEIDRDYNTTIEFYINKGFSEEEAKILLKNRQSTFSLEKCIAKLGVEEGTKRWQDRQNKWKSKVFNETTHISKGTSIESDELIEQILLNIKEEIKPNLLYGKNEKFIYDKENKRAYKYDLTNISNKKIIEFNGVFWHCKPTLFEENFIHPIKKITAKEIWEYDFLKIKTAKDHGYEILLIWEDEYLNDRDNIIKKCINFLNG